MDKIRVNVRETRPTNKSRLRGSDIPRKTDYFNLENTSGKEEWDGWLMEVDTLFEVVERFGDVRFKDSKFEEADVTAWLQ